MQWPNFGALKEELDAGTPVIAAIDVDDYFPETGDLPESIPQQLLEAEYGGVNGDRYLQLLDETGQRIANCALYQERLGTL